MLAAGLAELWSRLLLPHDAPEALAAADEAETLRRRLLERARMRAATDWLERRPQLGQTVFARGQDAATAATRAGGLADLLRACLVALQVPPSQLAQVRPRKPRLWQASEAIGLMRTRLGQLPNGSPLVAYLPPLAPGPDAGLRRRAALASTLVAGLELARDTVVTLEQNAPSAVIRVSRRHDASARGAAGSAA